MVCLLCSLTINAENIFFKYNNGDYRLHDGTAEFYGVPKNYSGDFIIPDSVEYANTIYPVRAIYNVEEGYKLTGLTIPSTVKYIYDYAFSCCYELRTLTIPNSVDSIGKSAFQNCKKLQKVVLPNSLREIKDRTFINCESLVDVKIPETVTKIGIGAFTGCKKLPRIVIPPNVRTIGESAFNNCSYLKSVTLPCTVVYEGMMHPFYDSHIIDTLRITMRNEADMNFYLHRKDIANTFTTWGLSYAKKRYIIFNGKDLTELKIPESVDTLPDNAFCYVQNIKKITIPKTLKNVSFSCFRECKSVKEMIYEEGCTSTFYTGITTINYLYLPSTLTSIGDNSFDKCDSLTSITLPNSVKTIGKGAFSFCSSLRRLDLGNSLEEIGERAFEHCYRLDTCFMTNTIRKIDRNAFESGIPNALILKFKDETDFKNYAARTDLENLFGTSTWLSHVPRTLLVNGKEITSLVLPDGVSNLGPYVFASCKNIESVTVSKDYESKSNTSFWNTNIKELIYADGCTYASPMGLTDVERVTIPGSLTKIERQSFQGYDNVKELIYAEGCTETLSTGIKSIKSISLPNTLTTINTEVFMDCKSLKSVIIPNNVVSIENKAFRDCDSLEKVVISNSVLTIGEEAFSSCRNLKNLTIGESVKSIGKFAFWRCSSLKSVTIPSSVRVIDTSAFCICDSLEDVTLGNSLSRIGEAAFSATPIKGIVFPNSIDSIGKEAFYHCMNITSIYIPRSVKYIGEGAFGGTGKVNDISVDKGNNTYSDEDSNCIVDKKSRLLIAGCNNSVIPGNISGIGEMAFYNCSELRNVTIPNTTKFIGEAAFKNCILSELTIPNSVDSLGNEALACIATKFILGDNIKFIGDGAFTYYSLESKDVKPQYFINKGSYTLLAYWNYLKAIDAHNKKEYWDFYKYIKINPIAPSTEEELAPPTLNVKLSATSGIVRVDNKYPEYNYYYSDNAMDTMLIVSNMDPGTTFNVKVSVYKDTLRYDIDSTLTTEALVLETQVPKVINIGNVIVQAKTNIDDSEKKVGFQWRRTDWTDDFKSNESDKAYLFEGTMEGYIRNLNSNYMWKYRPFYESSTGTRYYGDWVGIDPTNTSYFEPTVHTYDIATTEGTSVTLRGYAQRGTDNITSQGFVYWPVNGASAAKGLMTRAADVPSNAKRVEVQGTLMEVTIAGLNPNTTYAYTTYITTSENETFYGEEENFETGDGTTAISEVVAEPTHSVVIGIYDINGRKLNEIQHGLNIIRFEDGTVKKIFKK